MLQTITLLEISIIGTNWNPQCVVLSKFYTYLMLVQWKGEYQDNMPTANLAFGINNLMNDWDI